MILEQNRKETMMRFGRLTPLSMFFLAVVSLSLWGCATTRIDVDVYKGPLANHEKVQTEQMAVMAIGAKPLLVQLRGIMERRINKQFDTHRQKYLPSYKFKDDDARYVNEVLSLYEDRHVVVQ